ncbi:MAG: hypothetical protein JKY49_09265 [Cohaesibacteraceae bacterium]|nr:hypothetical protein [Cohaesibacteraceae bacterium]
MTKTTKTINIAAALIIGVATLGAAGSAVAGGYGNSYGSGNSGGYSTHKTYTPTYHAPRYKKKCWYKKQRVWDNYEGYYVWKKKKVCRKIRY